MDALDMEPEPFQHIPTFFKNLFNEGTTKIILQNVDGDFDTTSNEKHIISARQGFRAKHCRGDTKEAVADGVG